MAQAQNFDKKLRHALLEKVTPLILGLLVQIFF
jgi:hypothetical protein